ncbi:MAG: biotin transporter BioY [Christensenellales bacterium]|jgi:biotin transport system substrate-specific component
MSIAKTMSTAKSMTLCGFFAALIAVGAFMQIPLPSLTPLTLQTLFIYLAALLLSPRYSLLCVGTYLFIGLIGVPIFTQGGGIGYVVNPTFGYLLGFLVSAPTMSLLFRKLAKKIQPIRWRIVVSLLIGTAIIYSIGTVYMWGVLNLYLNKAISFSTAVWTGCVVFLPGDSIKIIVCTLVAPKIIKALRQAA